MVNQKKLGRILFNIQKEIQTPLPPSPVEDETPLQINLLNTILLPVFENGLRYYFVNDINADEEHKKYYRIKSLDAKGTGLEFNLSYKEYLELTLNNFIFDMEETNQRVNYIFTINEYSCYFKNEPKDLFGETYYNANYINFGYKSNNKITDENNGTIHHVRFITKTDQTADDPTYDKNNIFQPFYDEEHLTYIYTYEVDDNEDGRKLIIFYDPNKGQTLESAKTDNIIITVKKAEYPELSEDLPEKGTSEYYFNFFAYDIEFKNINERNNSNTDQSNDQLNDQSNDQTNDQTNEQINDQEPINP